MEINILFMCLPKLQRNVLDKNGRYVLDNMNRPIKENIPIKDLHFPSRYQLTNEIKVLQNTTQDEVLKTYCQSLYDKLNKITDDDLERVYKDYQNGKIITTERYILF